MFLSSKALISKSLPAISLKLPKTASSCSASSSVASTSSCVKILKSQINVQTDFSDQTQPKFCLSIKNTFEIN